jgi:hypothetical protein
MLDVSTMKTLSCQPSRRSRAQFARRALPVHRCTFDHDRWHEAVARAPRRLFELGRIVPRGRLIELELGRACSMIGEQSGRPRKRKLCGEAAFSCLSGN